MKRMSSPHRFAFPLIRTLRRPWRGAPLVTPLVALAALAFAASAQRAQAETEMQPTAVRFEEALVAFAEGRETINVIVTLRPDAAVQPARPGQGNRAATPLSPRQAQRREAVIARLDDERLVVRQRFESLPGFSAQVTVEGYRDLLDAPEVETVAPARLLTPHTQQGIALIGGLTYRASYGGQGVAVAVIDSGIDFNHPALGAGGYPNSKVIGGFDFGDNNSLPAPQGAAHGTAMAGIIAGDLTAGGGDFIGGVAPRARLYALKVTQGPAEAAEEDAVLAALDWCITHQHDDPVHPIQVIAINYGSGAFQQEGACNADSPLMTVAVDRAAAAGILVVASAGNSGSSSAIASPACLSSVLSVSAVYDAALRPKPYTVCLDPETVAADQVPCYANMAPMLDVLAPSHNAHTADIAGPLGYTSGDYVTDFGGTSAAAAYVAGAAAAIQSAAMAKTGAFLRPQAVRSLLIRTGRSITDPRSTLTKPRIRVAQAIDAITIAPALPDPLPPVQDQYFTFDGLPVAPADFHNGYGASVSWALGYYLKTYQRAVQLGLTSRDLENPAHQASPFFLWNNGGSDHFYLAGRLLEGHGAPTMATYSSYFQLTSGDHLQEAARWKSLSLEPFFFRRPVMNRRDEFRGGNWQNDLSDMQDWLNAGNGLVLGIPVYQSFLDYAPNPNATDMRDVIYMPRDLDNDPLVGFHALCVVGHLQSIRAFKVVNSWGEDWGIHPYLGASGDPAGALTAKGYGWISYEFVRRFAIEAWRLREPAPVSVTLEPTTRGARAVTRTSDYRIIYTGPGSLRWVPSAATDPASCLAGDCLMLQIENGGDLDTLAIYRMPGVTAGERIPAIETDGSLRMFHTQAPVGRLQAAGDIRNITAQRCHIAEVVVGGALRSVRMRGAADASWPEVASRHYRNAYTRSIEGKRLADQGIDMKLPNILTTRLISQAPVETLRDAPPLNVQLVGVVLDSLRVEGQTVSRILTDSIRYGGDPWSAPFVSYGGVDAPTVPIAQTPPDQDEANSATGQAAAPRSIAGLSDTLQTLAASENPDGMVDVVVTLRTSRPLPALQADGADGQALQAARQEIRQSQDTALYVLADEARLRRRFDNIPAFSASLTLEGLRRLAADPDVESITPRRSLRPALAQGIPLMAATGAREASGGAGVSIAICDTGVDYTHPLLGGGGFPNAKVIGGYDFGDDDDDPFPSQTTATPLIHSAHGTACAGIVAGARPDVPWGDYIGGVAPDATIQALKITGDGSDIAWEDDLIAAWDWCVSRQYADPDHPILVISVSFSDGRFFSPCDSYSPALTLAAARVRAAGIAIFAAAGNEGYPNALAWPACVSDVIAVGAVYDAAFGPGGKGQDPVTAADRIPWYSNTAAFLDLLAPSERAHTLDIAGAAGYNLADSPDGDYYHAFDGTSAACAYSAGAAALLQSAALARNGAPLDPMALRDLMRRGGDPIADDRIGRTFPRVNVDRSQALMAFSPVDPGQNWEQTWLSTLGDAPEVTDSAWYRIETSPLHTGLLARLEFNPAQGDLELEVYDGARQFIAGSEGTDILLATLPEAGVYYLHVLKRSGPAPQGFDLWWDDLTISPGIGDLGGVIVAGDVGRIVATGGAVRPGGLTTGARPQPGGIDVGALQGVVSRSMAFTTVFDDWRMRLPFPGDISLGTVNAASRSLILRALGGDTRADRIVVGGEITAMEARLQRFWIDAFDPDIAGDEAWTIARWFRGGVVGFAPPPTSLQVPKWMTVISGAHDMEPPDNPFRRHDIVQVYGDLAVFGIFAARPAESLAQPRDITPEARVRRIETRKYSAFPPREYVDVWWYRVEGEGYSARTPIRVITEDRSGFVQH